jgi:hypothetical protein
VTVEWAVDDVTTSESDLAVSGRAGRLTFAPGETSKPIVVPVAGDSVPEPDETFTVRLQRATNAGIGAGSATGTIVDDDARASACSPRPEVGLTSTRSGSDRLLVTVRAGSGSLAKLTFGAGGAPLQNAEVEMTGSTEVIRGGGEVTPEPGTTQVAFVVRRLAANQPVLVPLVVVDGCGEWRTFVGAGPTAF